MFVPVRTTRLDGAFFVSPEPRFLYNPWLGEREMDIKGIKFTWSSFWKLLAGVCTVGLSFYIFRYAPAWLKIIALAVLVAILFYPSLFLKKKLPPDLEKKLRDEDPRR
jgi:hypothetical protein